MLLPLLSMVRGFNFLVMLSYKAVHAWTPICSKLFGGNQKFSERAAWSRSIQFSPRYNLSSPGSSPPPAQDIFKCRYFHGSIVTHLLGMHLQHMIDLIDIFIDVCGVCQKWTPAFSIIVPFQATFWSSLANEPSPCLLRGAPVPSNKHLKATLWACRKMGYPYINLTNHNFPVGRFPKMRLPGTPQIIDVIILIGFSTINMYINHPFWGTPILGNLHGFNGPTLPDIASSTCATSSCCRTAWLVGKIGNHQFSYEQNKGNFL